MNTFSWCVLALGVILFAWSISKALEVQRGRIDRIERILDIK